ncbi:hypothetical protein Tco_0505169 [Tanacetum coccineum]
MTLKVQMKLVKQDDSVTGTKIPINPVPVAMKVPSIATYKIIKQGEKGVFTKMLGEDGTVIVYGMDGPEDELENVFWKYLKKWFEELLIRILQGGKPDEDCYKMLKMMEKQAGLWYPKGSGIETIVYADSDHAGDYVDRKSTSGVCTFMGCCLTSWFSKKQTALASSTYEAEIV